MRTYEISITGKMRSESITHINTFKALGLQDPPVTIARSRTEIEFFKTVMANGYKIEDIFELTTTIKEI